MPRIEAVPNVSEGRRPDVVAALAAAVTATAGVELLDVSADPVHHRSVLTLVGEPDALVAALLALYGIALERIDLRTHDGVHPRVGAVDVVPFVPLAPADMPACIDAARALGAAVADRFRIPVLLYEAAATAPHRRPLEAVRRGGLASLADRLRTGAWAPDFGPPAPHPAAGVSAIGARRPLVAFNVQLDTDDVEVARAVARRVRASGGGLAGVKAIGVRTGDPAVMQVAMNLVDPGPTSLTDAYDAVRREAGRRRVEVRDSEIVGLAPAATLLSIVTDRLRLRTFAMDRVLECRLGRAGGPGPPDEAA